MALATPHSLSQLSNIFEGELSSVDSDSNSSDTAVASVVRTPLKKPGNKKPGTTAKPPRPKRKEVIKSYAEISSDEESMPVNAATKTTKRKRNSSSVGSPTKKVKLDVPPTSRRRSFSSGQLPSLHNGNTLVASSLSASWPGVTTQSPLASEATRKWAYIRLDLDGNPAGPNCTDDYWWPAKKSDAHDDNGGTVYRLYGDDGHGSARTVTIHDPGSANVQSIYYPVPPLPRYSAMTFQKGSTIDMARFTAACAELNHDDRDDDAEEIQNFPYPQRDEVLSDGEQAPPSQASGPDWRPPSPSEFDYLIGELVLCKSKIGAAVHWPARITAYISPTKPSQKPRFGVEFFDWKTGEVTRDMFFTQYDEDRKAFAKCELDRRKLQEWVDKNSLSEAENDEVVVDDITKLPEPRFPIPKPTILIDQMTIEEQFTYVIPFMLRILEEEYTPSQQRIDMWMKGGSTRAGVTNNPIQGGHLAEVEWQLFTRLVRSWALPTRNAPNSEMATALDDSQAEYPSLPMSGQDSNTSPNAPECPKGSQRYESLPHSQKLQFIMDVLVGEAVIQLLIIRAGKRTDLSLLNDDEETELYRLGRRLSEQPSTSIVVRTILDLRKDIREAMRLPVEPIIAAGAKHSTEAELGTRRSKTRVHSQ